MRQAPIVDVDAARDVHLLLGREYLGHPGHGFLVEGMHGYGQSIVVFFRRWYVSSAGRKKPYTVTEHRVALFCYGSEPYACYRSNDVVASIES